MVSMAHSQQSATRGQVRLDGQVLSFSEIAALVGEAEGWRPEIGSEIMGTVLDVKVSHSDVSDRDYPIVFVLSPDKSVTAIHCFQTILYNEMVNQRPERGDRIYVKRLEDGEATRKGWNDPIRYTVGVEKQDASASAWDRLSGPVTAAQERTPDAPADSRPSAGGEFAEPMPE
jgi:hypothetical protein